MHADELDHVIRNMLYSDPKTRRTHPKKVRLTMLKLFFGAFLVVVTAQFARAQVTVDISKITCEQFNVLQKADSVAIWLSGYFHGQRRESIIDVNAFEDKVRDFRAACRQPDNFKRPVMQLIEGSQSR